MDSTCIPLKLKWIPPGQFTMGIGAIKGDDVWEKNEPEGEFEVVFSRGYWLGVYPVTQGQWQSVMETNPSTFKGENLPVDMIGWQDAVDFCRLLETHRVPRSDGFIFSLPTEAQWEYACLGGTTYKYQIGNSIEDLSRVAWYPDNISAFTTQPVGLKEPNNWGFYDMLGNVMEWCFDGPAEYPAGTTQVDWVGISEAHGDSIRSLRGGSALLGSPEDILTCTGRMATLIYPNMSYGFRLCLSYPKMG